MQMRRVFAEGPRHRRWRARPLGLLFVAATSGCLGPSEPLTGPEVALEAPLVLDLGWVARGEAVQGAFSIKNVGPSPVLLEGIHVLEGPRPLVGSQIEVRFEAGLLRPQEATEVQIRVIAGASAAGEFTAPLRVLAPVLVPDDPRLPVVELRFRVSPSGLVAEPTPLSIGPVPYLETATGTVAIRNLRSTPVEVFAFRYADGRAQFDEAVTRGAFGPLPPVDGTGRLGILVGGESMVVSITYTAPEGEGEAKEQAVWRVGSCPDPEECALTLVVQGLPDHEAPRLTVAPSGVHFGRTPVAAEVARVLRISNAGLRPLAVSEFVFFGSNEFTAVLPSDVVLAFGEAVGVRFLYRPNDESLDNAHLSFVTNDPSQPTARVRVTGSGVVLPPCRLEAVPSALDFGVVEVFESRELEARVRSTGDEPCLVFDPQVEATAGTDEGAFLLRGEAFRPVTLDPGEHAAYGVIFAPGRPGPHTGILRLRTSAEDAIEIPLRGRTPSDEGLTCSPPRTAEVGAPTRLVAALSRAVSARSYSWQLLSGPMRGNQIAGSFAPNPNAGPEIALQTDLLGVYEVQVDVETEAGNQFSCQTQVTAVSSGLKATLTWDGPGDLDLHLHRGNSSPWFGADDCHFENQTPSWVPRAPLGTGPNARLDRDDTSGEGPENIYIETPQIGVPYTLAVGHFERAQGRVAQVQVFCGRATTSLDVTSRAFSGDETGACTRNDFWTIATIRFTAPDQCNVETHDTYQTTAQACAAF